ncbi:MAG: hypothetical protein A2146_08840 [Actinobacteria bacterium RBG_16_67_10]|nr:MAG: hypothetical protein A2146_08840 [Actinobacteria bacterium RBG_16_67_10]
MRWLRSNAVWMFAVMIAPVALGVPWVGPGWYLTLLAITLAMLVSESFVSVLGQQKALRP